MKIIYVYGDGDYGAMTFEQSGISVKEAYEAAKKNNNKTEYEIDGDTIFVKAYEFNDVDPNFVEFIRYYIEDYDMAKNRTFYVVE